MISIGKTKFFEFMTSSIRSPVSEDVIPKHKRWLHKSDGEVTKSENKCSKKASSSILTEFTLDRVSFHDTPLDCWVVIYDYVYDITSFLEEHPGRDEVMLVYAGRDATLAFRSVGHSKSAEESLKPYSVGILVEEERIWTRMKSSWGH